MSPMRRMRKRGAPVSDLLISGPRTRAPCLLPGTVAYALSFSARNVSVNGRNSSLSYGRTDFRQACRVHKQHLQFISASTYIVSSSLQCYKSSKDSCPYVDLLLPQCTVVYAPKDSKRKHHELRFTVPNGDALVLAVQSKEQAHRWLRVSHSLI